MKKERSYRKLWSFLEKKGISYDEFKTNEIIGEELFNLLWMNKYVPQPKLLEICDLLGCENVSDICESIKRYRYNIMTLSGTALLSNYQVETDASTGEAFIRYLIDESDIRTKRLLIKSTDMYDDNAFLYQIRRVLSKQEDKFLMDENLFSQTLFFVDFETLFNNLSEMKYKSSYTSRELHPYSNAIDNNYRLMQLFEKGIYIINESGKYNHYIPFDKSSSMSRKGKISFVLEDVADKLKEPLNLGINFKEIQVIPSKYYAYRGLYLSNARRVEDERLKLDSKSVVIIDDIQNTVREKVITAVKDSFSKSKRTNYEVISREEDIKYEVFDGEGIISPQYAKYINDACGYEGATSFQIRLPFSKGMLHQVDFQSFISEFTSKESLIVEDCFHIPRDIMKADIIIPVSMFKCYKWIKRYSEIHNIEDPIEFYFNQVKTYEHSLYISNTDLIYGKSDYTKINYQILNTLSLNSDGFQSIIDNHLNYANNPFEYLKKDVSLGRINEEEYDSDDLDNNTLDFDSGIRKFIKTNNQMFFEPRINEYLNSISYSLKQDFAKGRLLVNGEIRYLSRDLLYFLVSLLWMNKETREVAIKIDKYLLKNEHFYIPQKKVKYGTWYPIFRNPHLSRNEQCLLSAWYETKLKDKGNSLSDVYLRYFGHLRGIIMVPYDSLAPQTLGGADFDGDIIKIIFDDSIIKAVKEGTYEEEKKKLKRKLPIVVIPSSKGEEAIVSDVVPYSVIKNTFSNSIGRISNLSISIGQFEYGEKDDSEVEHSCAECTILTGIEIDAAKTGVHPSLSGILKYGKTLRTQSSFDYVYDFKNAIEELGKKQVHISGGMIESDKTEDGRHIYRLKKYKKDDECLIEYVCKDEYNLLNMLPRFYFESITKAIETKERKEKKGERKVFFKFQENIGSWRKEVDSSLKEQVGAIALAYHRINQVFNKVHNWERNKSKYGGHIRTILRNQYDYLKYDEILSNDLTYLWDILDNLSAPSNEILELLKDNNWPFLLNNQKETVFNNVFLSHSSVSNSLLPFVYPIISNYDYSGYNLLIYALEESAGITEEKNWEDYILSGYESFTSNVFKKRLDKVDINTYEKTYSELKEIMMRNERIKKTEMSSRIFELCKKKIEDIILKNYDKDKEDFLEKKAKLLFSISGAEYPDNNGDFFWKNLDYNEINSLIYCGKKDVSQIVEGE